MTAPGGNDLPPIVQKILGDASDLINAFASATAAEKAFEKATGRMQEKVSESTRKSGRDVDDFTALVVRRMKAGEDAVSALRRGMASAEAEVSSIRKRMSREAANQGIYADFKRASDELQKLRKLARELAPDLLDSGRRSGQGFTSSFIEGLSALPGAMMPILIGGVILATPVISALIGSAVAVGLGLGFIGLGTVLAAMLIPQVKRAFQTIGSSFQGALRFAVQGGFKSGLLDALSIFNRYIPIFGHQLRSIFDQLAPALAPLANALGEGIKGFLAEIMGAMPQIMPILLTFISTIPEVMRGVAEFLVAITADGPALSRFITDAANAIVAFLRSSGEVISWLTGVYNWAVKLNESFPFIGWQAQLDGWLHTILPAIGAFFTGLWDKIVTGAKAVGEWFANLGRNIRNWMKGAGRAIADFVVSTTEWFAKLPGRVVGFLASMPARVTAVVSRMAHQAAYWVGWLVGTWVRYLMETPGKVAAIVSSAWSWVAAKFREGVTNTINNIRAFPGQVASFFAGMWAAVTGWVSRTYTSVTGWMARTKASMIMHAASAINAVIGWFKALPGRAAAEASNFKTKILKFFSGAKDWLYDAGKDLIRGFVDGISHMWSWAVDKVKGFGRDIVKGLRGALDSHSPSRAAYAVGQDFGAGFGMGAKDSLGKFSTALRRPANTPGATVHFSAPSGAPRPYTGAPPPGAGSDAYMVHTTISIDGRAIVTAITPAAQRRKARSGTTGLG